MGKKVFIIEIKESNTLVSTFEAYDSFKKAKGSIFEAAKRYFDRKVLETSLKNEFEVVQEDGTHIHTLRIIDLWLR